MSAEFDDDSIVIPEYIEKLYKIITRGVKLNKDGSYKVCLDGKPDIKPEEIGAVGGIVPPFGSPKHIRNIKRVSPIFNKITFHKDRVDIGDDGGYFYQPNQILDSDHLRSSFMYRKSVWKEVNGYDKIGGMIGWREETNFTMKLKWAGYKLLTDTSAVCWHAHASQGGARFPPNVYRQKLDVNEQAFQKWALRQYKKHGEKY